MPIINSKSMGQSRTLLSADSSEVTQTGTTPLEVKNMSFLKDVVLLNVNSISVGVEIKTDNVGTTAHCRIRHDGGGSDDLDITTVSATYEIKTGTIDTSGWSDGRHTIEILIDDGSGDTITLRETEIHGE